MSAAAIKLVLRNKKVTNYELTARDVTELRRFEKAQQENYVALDNAKTAAEIANRAKSEFLAIFDTEISSKVLTPHR